MPSASHDVILFDLDGTLTDSAPGIVNCLHYALARMGLPGPDDATVRTMLGPPLVVTFRDRLGMSEADASRAIGIYRERYHDVGLFENEVYDGIPDLLLALGRTPATLAIATSKPTVSASRILDHFGLADHFAFIAGAELDGPRQAKADVVAHALEELAARARLTSESRVVMVGDREHDVIGARAHGIDCIGVLWGYGDAAELRSAGAAAVVATPTDLESALIR